jgi:hypothetical protein
MGLNANKAGGEKQFTKQDNLEPATYPARLVQLIDLGLQAQREFKGQAKAPVQEIMLTYELVDTFMKDEKGNDIEDKPRWINEILPFYGLFADKAKSTQRYNAFDPNGVYDGDFARAVGNPVNVTIVNNKVGDKVYDNVGAVNPMRAKEAEKCPPLINPAVTFDLDAPNLEVFNKLPKFVKDKIIANLNYNGSALSKLLGDKPAPKAEEKPAPAPAAEADAADDNPY